VVEFNARFGDPDSQVVLARLRTPLGGLLRAAAAGRLHEVGPLEWSDNAVVSVVVAAKGYPESPKTGDPVFGVEAARRLPGVTVLHAGTQRYRDDVVSSGGRVLNVLGTGRDVAAARATAYDGLRRIRLAGKHVRGDIAADAAGR
jgi:phosphoribosylamine---glycine ligase